MDALRMTAIGIAAGLVLSLAATPLIRAMLFQTSTADPASVLFMIIVLLTTTVVAAAVPAWRAGRVSPMVALNSEVDGG
jgi:ABC-type antimicrobial peptide transport system permease subunit